MSPVDIDLIYNLVTAHLMFEKLRTLHEQQGAFAQLNLLLKGLEIDFTYEKSLHDMLSELCTYYHCIVAMGSLKNDNIFSILILNALSKNFGPLQHSINSLSKSSTFNSKAIASRILDEDALICHRIETGQPANPYTLSPSITTTSAFAAVSHSWSPQPPYANCKKETHHTDYCIAPGGKITGKTLEEARAARTAA